MGSHLRYRPGRGTNDHENLKNFFRVLQKDDLRRGKGAMVPKGGRSLFPHALQAPDIYLRVVEKSKEGI